MADDVAIDITQNADGSIVVDLETHRRARQGKRDQSRFDANLAEGLGQFALSNIANNIYEGITADINSRTDWVTTYNNGLELLGLKIESPGLGQKTSKVRHPQLLWTIVKFQSLSQGEMLPSNGPVKVRKDDNGSIPNEVAEDLERYMNHYLTTRASEYYPDTDRGLFFLGYGGTIYKKVYHCPIRRRPVSETVTMPELIVSQDATDLLTALRVTHEIPMTGQQVLRYQDMGYWRDVPLGRPVVEVSSTEQAEARVTGVAPAPERWQDYPHTIWECYTTLNLTEYGLGESDQGDEHELPYRVTIDKSSRQVLEIRRNWRKDDPLRLPRKRFSKWGLIPGIGFLALGYLHLLGNNVKAMTAIERVLIDSGIFSNFPGGVRVKGMRQETNEIQPGPGEFPEIDTGGLPIQQALMALPFKGPSAELLALLQGLQEQNEKLAGVVEVQVGDGKTNVPVGTIMAQIEQATQIMMAIHKRLHVAQAEELQMLRDLLCEDPQALFIPGEQPKWSIEQLRSASLVPASDPNIPAHVHRIMQAVVLEELATKHPDIYVQREVQKRILRIARIDNFDELMVPLLPPGAQPQGADPMAQLAAMQAQIETMRIQLEAQGKAAELKQRAAETEQRAQSEQMRTQADLARTEMELAADAEQRQADRDAQERQHAADLANKAADRSSKEQMSEFAQRTDADLAAQERQAQMDLARMDAELGLGELALARETEDREDLRTREAEDREDRRTQEAAERDQRKETDQ